MEIDPATGMLAYGEVVIIGPRQIGKTELMLPAMTHRCVGFGHAGPQRVLYTTQTADKAREKWRDVHLARLVKVRPLLRQMSNPNDPVYGGARLRLNQEAMFWRSGAIWSPGSTTGKTAGTGDTLDMAVIDEAWSRPDMRTELGLRPAMLTRPWKQLWILSMIPGLSRAMPGTWPYLANKRKIGRARVEAGVNHGVAFFDFSAAEGMDPGDPATWWSFHPGLISGSIPEGAIQADFEAFDLVDFEAEYLGWAPQESVGRWKVVPEQTWNDQKDPGSQLAGSYALALEIDEERMTGVIGASGLRPDAHWHTEILEPGQNIPATVGGTSWMHRRTIEICVKHPPSCIVIDPRRPASSMVLPLRKALEDLGLNIPVYTPNTIDVAAACGRWYDRTGAAPRDDDDGVRLWHLGQPELDSAVSQSRKLDQGTGGAFVFVKRGSAGVLTSLYTSVLSMLGAEVYGVTDYAAEDSVDSTRACQRCGRFLYRHHGAWLHGVDDTPECS